MSGVYSQVGFANEVGAAPVSTAGTSTAAAIGGTPYTNQLTFGSAHGLSVGDKIVLAGYTPSTWNGTWIVFSVPSATTLTFLSQSSLGPVTVQGTNTSNHYASTVTGGSAPFTITPAPSRFMRFRSETVELINNPMVSEAVGNSARVQKSTRVAWDRVGASGQMIVEAESKGFGFFLPHMIGPVVTTGPTDSAYTHTSSMATGASPPPLLGSSFNWQGTVVPAAGFQQEMIKTGLGFKIPSWQLDFEVGKIAVFALNVDGQDLRYDIAKAVAAYSVNPELLTFAGGAVTIAGNSWDVVKKGTLKMDNGYDADRRFVRSTTLQKEPAAATMPVITLDMDGEFDSVLAFYNRYASPVAADHIVTVALTFVGKILIGATTYPSLTFTINAGRIDGKTPMTQGVGLPQQHATITTMWDETNSPIIAAYVTTDSTP